MDIEILSHKFFDYSLHIRGYSKDTIKRYRQIIRLYCRFANVTMIEEITRDNVRNAFYYGRTERQWKPNTFICFHKSLAVFFRWCMSEGYMSFNPTEELSYDGMKHLVKKLNNTSGVKFHLHQFRHTFAMNFLKQSNNIYKLKELMGHKDIRMTAAYLKNLPTDEMRGDIEKMSIDGLI